MRFRKRIEKLERTSRAGRCRECGAKERGIVSIEEREELIERIDAGGLHCRSCAEHMLHRTKAIPQDMIDVLM